MRNAILRNYLKGQFFNRVSMQIFGQFVNRVEKIAGFGLNRVRISGSECPPPLSRIEDLVKLFMM